MTNTFSLTSPIKTGYPAYATVPGWCAISGMRRTTTYHEISRGNLRAIKLGARTLLDVQHGLAWLATLPPPTVTMLGRQPPESGRLTTTPGARCGRRCGIVYRAGCLCGAPIHVAPPLLIRHTDQRAPILKGTLHGSFESPPRAVLLPPPSPCHLWLPLPALHADADPRPALPPPPPRAMPVLFGSVFAALPEWRRLRGANAKGGRA